MSNPVETLRNVWTPGKEVEEVFADLSPQTELDSMIRHFLHAILQQGEPLTIDLSIPNTGNMRWEIIHGPGPNPTRQVSLWVEE